MLETIGAAVFEWMVGETLDKARLEMGRGTHVRDLDRVIGDAVAPAVAVATTNPEAREEHPDWKEYREAMRIQDKSLIRVTPTRWGPIATGGFPADVAARLDG